MRLGILVPRATSLKNVARDIALVAEEKGYPVVIFEQYMSYTDAKRIFDACVMIAWSSPITSQGWWMTYREYKRWGMPIVMYTTTEGRIKRFHVQPWHQRDIEFVANSRYTKSRLEEVGLRVIDVVPHGINLDLVKEAKNVAPSVWGDLIEACKGKIVFVTVASAMFRKGIDLLGKAIGKIVQKYNDVVFIVWSTRQATSMVPQHPQVKLFTEFGNKPREEVLALMAIADYVIHPATGEGFGLPVLEAMALGKPVIHVNHPAIMEFTCKKANIIFSYSHVVTKDMQDGILYELYMYSPDDLVWAIEQAIDIKKNKPDVYKEMCREAEKHARQYDIRKVYPRLLKYVGVE